jgi:DNA-cytosine methyltransferase
MNVISLFDGISCGRVALERANINVTKYYASEIDKYAIQVSQNNYPDIIRLGDINNWGKWDIDWYSIDLILAGSPCQGFSFAGKQLAFDDKRSALFFRFAEILSHVQSVNPSVKFLLENVRMKKEFEHVITSVIGVEPIMINSALVSAQNRKRLYWCNWHVEQPEDKGILLNDVLLEGESLTDKSQTILSTLYKENAKSMLKRNKKGLLVKDFNQAIFQRPRGKNKGAVLTEKSPALTSNSFEHNNFVCSDAWINWWNKNKEYQISKKYSFICNDKQKAITLTARQYACWNGNFYQIGDNKFRKLTPIEFERLQTLPDNYTAGISNSQRYKCLGNGWTVDVIAHILNQMNKGNNNDYTRTKN